MSKQWVLLWSQSQNALHIETVEQMTSRGRKAYQENRRSDYVAIYVGERAHIDAAAGFCHQTLAQRQDEANLRKPDLAHAHVSGGVSA